MDKPDPSPSGENARSATPAAPRQPEGPMMPCRECGGEQSHWIWCSHHPAKKQWDGPPKSEPEGPQDLSEEEIVKDWRERFNSSGARRAMFDEADLRGYLKRQRAQPAPADAAPLDAELETEHCSLCEQMAVDGHELYTCDCCGKLACTAHSDNAGEHEIVCDSCISLVESRLGREDKADAAPLDALRLGFKIARENVIASSSGDGWSDRTYTTLHWEQAERKLAEALASAEGASAAPRLQPEGHIPLGAPDARPEDALRAAIEQKIEEAAGKHMEYERDDPGKGRFYSGVMSGLESAQALLAAAKPPPEKPAASGPSPDALLAEALDALEELMEEVAPLDLAIPCLLCGARGAECCSRTAAARAVLRRGGRHD